MPTKVHIACYDDSHIVPRMMQWLVDGLGWSMGSYLTVGGSIINYYAPYTMYGRFGPVGGKSIGWFTHKESKNQAKMAVWKNAAKNISLPLVTAPIYQKELGAALITPGIDQAHFKPTKKRYPGKNIIGLAGVPQSRKGTDLAVTLNDIEAVNEVRAIGGKWPGIKSEEIDYKDIPAFYAGLDLFVCTSTEEGVPAPPLEALACGVPVLIPIGVGMLDDLPHEPGIYRYTAGDVDEMLTQVELILNQTPKHNRATLRDYVAPYTVDAWVQSHKDVVDNFLHV